MSCLQRILNHAFRSEALIVYLSWQASGGGESDDGAELLHGVTSCRVKNCSMCARNLAGNPFWCMA